MAYLHKDEQQSFHNLAIGVVCGYGDDKHPFTIHVKLPFLEDSSNIIQNVEILQPYGGKDYGCYVRPELNERVVLLFYGQLQRRAIAIGSTLYEGNTLMKELDKDNLNKIWKTKGGAHLSINDEKDKMQIVIGSINYQLQILDDQKKLLIQDQDMHNVIEMNEEGLHLQAYKQLQLSCKDCSILLKENGSCEIKAKTIELASDNLNIKTKSSLSLSAQKTSIEGKVETKIAGKSALKLESSGVVELQGNLIKIG